MTILNRQCERLSSKEDSKKMDWKLNVAAGSDEPRYVFFAFQSGKDINQIENPAMVDHMNVTNAYV